MFTGLIREVAKVKSLQNDFLTVASDYTPALGDSIAINGVCLSVVEFSKGWFKVEISPETRAVVAIENFKDGVHIEPAMRVNDRLEGHIVQGHIDAIGVVKKIERESNGVHLTIEIPKEKIKFVIPKGSIAIDGVSLTVNEVYESSFKLTIIPITINHTIIKNYRVGTRVNVETDMFARYLYHMFSTKDKSSGLSWDEIDSMMARF